MFTNLCFQWYRRRLEAIESKKVLACNFALDPHFTLRNFPAMRLSASTTESMFKPKLLDSLAIHRSLFDFGRTRYDRKLWIRDLLRNVVYLPFEQSNGKADVGGVGGKDTPMDRIHQDEQTGEQFLLDLDEIARLGARRMLAEALEAEVEAYLEAASEERDERGRALVVRNGHARKREVVCGAGAVEVRAPRISDRRVEENGQRRCDDLQADGSGRGEVEEAKRTSSGSPGEGGSRVCQWRVGGEKRGEGRRVSSSRSTTFDNTSTRTYRRGTRKGRNTDHKNTDQE
jgi:Transposase, Mutator family